MPTCPHCGKDTNTEQSARPGSVDAGEQLYRQRKRGARILSGDEPRADVMLGPDAA